MLVIASLLYFRTTPRAIICAHNQNEESFNPAIFIGSDFDY